MPNQELRFRVAHLEDPERIGAICVGIGMLFLASRGTSPAAREGLA